MNSNDLFLGLSNISPELKKLCKENLEYYEGDLLIHVLLGEIVEDFVQPHCKDNNFSNLIDLFKFMDNAYEVGDEPVNNAVHVTFLGGIVNEDYLKDIKQHNLLGDNLKREINSMKDWQRKHLGSELNEYNY